MTGLQAFTTRAAGASRMCMSHLCPREKTKVMVAVRDIEFVIHFE